MRVLTFLTALLVPVSGFALGPTERACIASERSPGRAVCACAQQMADQSLSPEEQRLAAKIIGDPDAFVAYQGSTNPARRAFVERYRAWGSAAEAQCQS